MVIGMGIRSVLPLYGNLNCRREPEPASPARRSVWTGIYHASLLARSHGQRPGDLEERPMPETRRYLLLDAMRGVAALPCCGAT